MIVQFQMSKTQKAIVLGFVSGFAGWMFSSKLQEWFDSIFPDVHPLIYVGGAVILALFGLIKLK